MSNLYGSEYALRYADKALRRPYTQYKNDVVASIFARRPRRTGTAPTVLDIGCNVNGVFQTRGLRQALGQHGMEYVGLDLDLACFDTGKFIRSDEQSAYPKVDGVVADATSTPFRDEAYAAVTCNDVIEHIEDPSRVLQEINRVLTPDGQAVVIVPSLYKLDGFHSPHVDDVRMSSHVNRFGLDTWVDLIKNSGLRIDRQQSRPMGIASGLTYFMWGDQEFVPRRAGVDANEEYSLLSDGHRDVKRRLSERDELVDQFYLNDPIARGELMTAVINADSIDSIYRALSNHVGEFYDDDVMRDLLLLGERADVPEDRLYSIQRTMRNVGELALGNSAVFVLNKSVE